MQVSVLAGGRGRCSIAEVLRSTFIHLWLTIVLSPLTLSCAPPKLCNSNSVAFAWVPTLQPQVRRDAGACCFGRETICVCLLPDVLTMVLLLLHLRLATVSFIDYPRSTLPSADFQLDATIEPVLLSTAHWNDTEVAAHVLPHRIAHVDANKYHRRLSQLVCSFVENRKHGTRSEDALHGRDDHLLDIICLVSGLQPERNTVSFSTKQQTRSDVYLALPGCPPLVHVEEKAAEGDLPKAISELSEKFCALPHYDRRLQFIVAIAIAGDFVQFGLLPLVDGGNAFQYLPNHTHAFSLADVRQRLVCVQAAINVGRWARHAVEQQLVSAVPFPIGQKQTDADGRRDITLLSEGIIVKRYLKLGPQQWAWLRQLYSQPGLAVAKALSAGGGGSIRFMEWATETKERDGAQRWLQVKLRPFGVVASSRPPSTLAELRSALRCILTSLVDLHAAGWAHLDLRWSNIVFMAPNEWYVIDAEFARPFGSDLPDLKVRDKEAKQADAQADCYLVGCMMKEMETKMAFDAAARDVLALLLGPRDASRRSAQRALQMEFFA